MEYITTDGSLKGKRGGWAVIVRGDKKRDIGGSFECDDSYKSELVAIAKAAAQAEGEFIVFTDHKGIANELNNMIFNDTWAVPEKENQLWKQIKDDSGNLKGAYWQKRHSTQELRKAHKMASTHADRGF